MKERPILMTPENVRKILDQQKTQTRRIVKCPHAPMHLGTWEPTMIGGPHGGKTRDGRMLPEQLAVLWHTRTGAVVTCPYGEIGSWLWIREPAKLDHTGWPRLIYKADGATRAFNERDLKPFSYHKWTPSIHMPRWACRLIVEVTDVRIQRLQNITTKDCIAEGVDNCRVEGGGVAYEIDNFIHLWESIHGTGSWGLNPFVWAISFRRMHAQ